MISIVILGLFVILLVLFLPVLNGIGSYKLERVPNDRSSKRRSKATASGDQYQADSVKSSSGGLRNRISDTLSNSGISSSAQIHFEPRLTVKHHSSSLDGDITSEYELDRFIEEEELKDREDTQREARREARQAQKSRQQVEV
jgi:hypothetical protein